MSSNEKDLTSIKAEHMERLLGAYRGRAKSFQQLFNSLTLFALLFLFIILFPYISLQIESRRISAELNVLHEQLSPTEDQLKVYRQAQGAIQELSQALKDSPEELNRFIVGLESNCREVDDNPNFPVQDPLIQNSPIQGSPIQGPSSVQNSETCPSTTDASSGPLSDPVRGEWYKSQIQDYVRTQFNEFGGNIDRQVITPFQSIDPSDTPIDLAALSDGLGNIEVTFNARLDENPYFWRQYVEKVRFYEQLDQTLGGVWGDFEELINEQDKKLAAEIAILQAEVARKAERQAQLAAEETKIGERLAQIESPIGKIPVGLQESVLVFPLALSIGFFICASLFVDTIHIRWSFHELYQQKDPEQQIIDAQQISLIAPLPVDPNDDKQKQAAQLAWLLVPFVVFIIASGLILFGWMFSMVDPGSQPLKLPYTILYLASLILFIYSYRRVLAALKRYGKDV